jgi:CheY-like chemotaxis protein
MARLCYVTASALKKNGYNCNEDNVYVLRTGLTRAGFTVLVATDGAQGAAMALAEQPDLILMDLSLPIVNGWEATRQLKAAPQIRHIPVSP